jgi:hypothetical protein
VTTKLTLQNQLKGILCQKEEDKLNHQNIGMNKFHKFADGIVK